MLNFKQMNKLLIYIIGVVIISAGLFSSCEDSDFLDKTPSGELTEDEVWSSWTNMVYYYNDTYNFLRNGQARIADSWMDAATDLAVMSRSSCGTVTSFNVGNFYAEGGEDEILSTWETFFRGIRKVNLFLENIDEVPDNISNDDATNATLRARYTAEMRFFRAYFYWQLCLRYGSLPIMDESIDPDADLADVLATYERPETSATCFNWILAELDTCYSDSIYTEADIHSSLTSLAGKVSKGTVLALKSRIKLYMASPFYQDLDVCNWQEAADEAKSFIDLYNSYYYLYNTNSTGYADLYGSALNTIVADGGNPEPIFWRNDASGDWWQDDSPVGYGGYGGLCPSQNLVDMYDMADGTSPFTEYDATGAPVYDSNGEPTVNTSSSYDENNPYENRDPRMEGTILFNGSEWWNRAIETTVGGTDNPTGNAYATPTSYYNRKYHDDTQTDYTDDSQVMYRNWIFIRYAEILLNYAEAMNEAYGPSDEVFDALQQLRDRVGMTALLSERSELWDKATLRNFIHKERTIELAFEDHRWWDVRRWGVADEAIARPIYGMTITEDTDGNLSYERNIAQERVYQDRFSLYPIPEEEIWKTGWDNNSGW